MKNAALVEKVLDVIQNESFEDDENLYNIPPQFIEYLQGKPFVKYAGVLSVAHKKGIKSFKTEPIQLPVKENESMCIFKATLIGTDGSEWEDYGDASPKSVGSKIVPHIIRQASTRAKARVLRDYCNIGLCTVEELDLDDVKEDPASEKQKSIIKDNWTISDENLDKLTKSQASKIIDQIKNGKGSSKSNQNKKDDDEATDKQKTQLKKYANKLGIIDEQISHISKKQASELLGRVLNSTDQTNQPKTGQIISSDTQSGFNQDSKPNLNETSTNSSNVKNMQVAEIKLAEFLVKSIAKKEGSTVDAILSELQLKHKFENFKEVEQQLGKKIIAELQSRKSRV